MTTAAKSDVLRVTEVKARDFAVACPKCGHVAEAWVCDPRGREDTCDKCGTKYFVAANADVTFA